MKFILLFMVVLLSACDSVSKLDRARAASLCEESDGLYNFEWRGLPYMHFELECKNGQRIVFTRTVLNKVHNSRVESYLENSTENSCK